MNEIAIKIYLSIGIILAIIWSYFWFTHYKYKADPTNFYIDNVATIIVFWGIALIFFLVELIEELWTNIKK